MIKLTSELAALLSNSGGVFASDPAVALSFKYLTGMIGNTTLSPKTIVLDRTRKGIISAAGRPKN
jgi:hypothetical protein